MTSLAALLADLAAGSGARLERVSPGEFTVQEWRGQVLERPVRLTVSDSSLAAYLDANGADALDVFPDVDPRTAAYRLLLVNLDESFVGGAPEEIVVDARGTRSIGTRRRSAIRILDDQGLSEARDREWVPGHQGPRPE